MNWIAIVCLNWIIFPSLLIFARDWELVRCITGKTWSSKRKSCRRNFVERFCQSVFDFLLSEILVARPRVIRVKNKVLSPLSSYQFLFWAQEPWKYSQSSTNSKLTKAIIHNVACSTGINFPQIYGFLSGPNCAKILLQSPSFFVMVNCTRQDVLYCYAQFPHRTTCIYSKNKL